MKKLLLLIAIAVPLFGQQKTPVSSVQPDCMVFLPPTSGTGLVLSTRITNAQVGCDTWTLFVSTIGFAGGDTASIRLDSALNGANATTPGAFGAFTGTITAGVNPVALGPGASKGILFAGSGGDGAVPWVELEITAFSSTSGTVTGILYGFKNPASGPGGGGGGGGCVGTNVTPCVVDGPNAAGTAPTFPPVLAAGQTGNQAAPGTVQTLHVDANGNTIVVGTAADGAAVSGSPVRVGGKDGSGNTQDAATDTRGDFLVVVDGNPGNFAGQQAVTTSAVALASNVIRGVCIKALKGNSTNVYVGPTGVTTANGMELAAGDALCTPATNTNLLFVIAASGGSSVSWYATAP